MPRRHFTEEELEAIANKEWQTKTIFTSNEKYAQRAKNLKGPRTVEGKKKSLQNLQVGRNKGEMKKLKDGGYVGKILNEEEQEYYFSRKEDYLKDYDINNSADEMTLHTVLMEEVVYYRLMKAQALKPSLDINKPLDDCTKRLRAGLDDLGALRRQRLKQDDKQNAISIASIAQAFFKEISSGSVQQLLDEQAQEEADFLAKKRERDAEKGADIIEGDYKVVETEEDE